MVESFEVSTRLEQLRGDRMRTPDEVAAMLRLKALGRATDRQGVGLQPHDGAALLSEAGYGAGTILCREAGGQDRAAISPRPARWC